jgi:hypothetical protein
VSQLESRAAIARGANPGLGVRRYHDRDGAAGILKNALNLGSEIDALVDGTIENAHQQQIKMTYIQGSQNRFLGFAGRVDQSLYNEIELLANAIDLIDDLLSGSPRLR